MLTLLTLNKEIRAGKVVEQEDNNQELVNGLGLIPACVCSYEFDSSTLKPPVTF